MRIHAALLAVALLPGAPQLRAQAVSEHAVPVSVRWNRLVPHLVAQSAASRRAARATAAAAGDSVTLRRLAQTPPPILFRVYTLLSVAQYGAATSALDEHTSPDAAVASASAAVLTEVFTDSAVRASIARELARDLDRARAATPSDRVSAGAALGAEVTRRVLAWAPPLNFAAQWSGDMPKGPGMWYGRPRVPPEGIFLARSRPWLLDTVAQFRPEPPPTFDSPAFRSALEEVRRVAHGLTPEQATLARKWSAADPWAVWNEIASTALRRNRVPELEAARVLAVLNAASSDAVVACFEAKYHYWTIRPSQADTTIVLPDSVGLPNFPSYPAGHACSAGAFEAVLAHFLPQDRAEFARIAEEQAMARLYGGVHYRFDNDVGLALGRRVGLYSVEAERRGRLTTWRSEQREVKR